MFEIGAHYEITLIDAVNGEQYLSCLVKQQEGNLLKVALREPEGPADTVIINLNCPSFKSAQRIGSP